MKICFEIMGALAGKGYLLDSKGRKSVNFTPEGVAAAKRLEKKYRQRAGKEAK